MRRVAGGAPVSWERSRRHSGGTLRRWTAGLWVLLIGVVSGCEGEGSGGPPSPGNEAPSFVAATLEGDSVAVEDLRGRPVLLNVWATWCAPCRREKPFLQGIDDRLGPRGLQVVGVSVDVGRATGDIERFLEEFQVRYTILHDPDQRIMSRYSVPGLPTTYLIDSEGTIRLVRIGLVTEEDHEFLAVLEDMVS